MGEIPHGGPKFPGISGSWGICPGAGVHQDFAYLRKLGVQKNLTLLRFFLTVDFGTVMLAYRQI